MGKSLTAGDRLARHVNSARLARHVNSARLAMAVFCAVEAVAFAWWLLLGRGTWFNFDEWVFLTGRGLGAQDLLAPFNGHWSTLPTLAYRLLFGVVGLRSYAPYLAVTISLQVTTAALLRVIMRRLGIGPWIATAAASLYVLFGAGAENVLWAWQMSFVGALVFGLVHLLLVDHDGPIDRRDWLGLAAGLAALMCSGVGVAMVVMVGIAALIRRGWHRRLERLNGKLYPFLEANEGGIDDYIDLQ